MWHTFAGERQSPLAAGLEQTSGKRGSPATSLRCKDVPVTGPETPGSLQGSTGKVLRPAPRVAWPAGW